VLDNLPDQPFTLEIRNTCAPTRTRTCRVCIHPVVACSRSARRKGFRRITYFTDRPDVMATYKVTLEG
jgi:aminopeptidase N